MAPTRRGVVVDGQGRTGTKGTFAAGDVTGVPRKQIAIAVGAGANAALPAFKYLITQV